MPNDTTPPTMVLFRPDVSKPGVRAGLAAVGGLTGLARALVASPTWARIGAAAVSVRHEPEPMLGIVGRFDEAATTRLSVLTWQFDHVLPRTMVLSYADVEVAVERLATALVARFGARACASFRYAALPRGGHVVLGLLAYALGLAQDRLDASAEGPEPLVVVDDCFLSGSRLRRFLDPRPAGPAVIAAGLFAAPELRAAAERDARVRAVVSAYDLRDASERRKRDDHASWQAQWQERGQGGYWIGQPQHVVFPWNEPDIGFWNPASGRAEPMWRLASPDRCAKNRPSVDTLAPHVHEQHAADGPIRVARNVLAAAFEDGVVIGAPHWSGCLTLEGTAAAMWDALVDHGSASVAADALAALYDVEPERLRADLEAFAAALAQRGALEVDAS